MNPIQAFVQTIFTPRELTATKRSEAYKIVSLLTQLTHDEVNIVSEYKKFKDKLGNPGIKDPVQMIHDSNPRAIPPFGYPGIRDSDNFTSYSNGSFIPDNSQTPNQQWTPVDIPLVKNHDQTNSIPNSRPNSRPNSIPNSIPNFIQSPFFQGSKPGYVFTTRDIGTGYYLDF
jgi:hypothetical protein